MELLSGATTFLTMAYIIFVQPGVLSGSMFDMDTADGLSALPASVASPFSKMDIAGAFTAAMVPIIVILLFTEVFDTAGTLIGFSSA